MNKERRKEIDDLVELLGRAKDEAERIMEEEQDYFDNMPEGIQMSERGEVAEAAVNDLGYTMDNIDEAISNLECARDGG